jgi:hypothetical protein
MHCTTSILAHVCAYAIDHVEPKPEIKKEQVQGVFGGPQDSSYKDVNSVVVRQAPVHHTRSLTFIFVNTFMLCTTGNTLIFIGYNR